MTVSMRVPAASDGYMYLLRMVTVGDGDRSLSTPFSATTPRKEHRLAAGWAPMPARILANSSARPTITPHAGPASQPRAWSG